MMRLHCERFIGKVGECVVLCGQDYIYVVRARRYKVGGLIHLFCADVGEWLAQIVHIDRYTATCELKQRIVPPVQKQTLGRQVHLAAAYTKADAWHWMLEKVAELGVSHIYPLLTERVQNVPLAKRSDKWQSIVKGAVQQCGRLPIPILHEVQTLSSFVAKRWAFRWNVALERHDAAPGLSVHKSAQDVGILIGPAGGFTLAERDWMQQNGFLAVSLGSYILKAETAAIAAVSCVTMCCHKP